jgi:hypothetical protein
MPAKADSDRAEPTGLDTSPPSSRNRAAHNPPAAPSGIFIDNFQTKSNRIIDKISVQSAFLAGFPQFIRPNALILLTTRIVLIG